MGLIWWPFQTPETSVPRTLHYLLEPQIRNTLADRKHFIRWVLSPCSGSSHCKLLFILPCFSLLLTLPSGLIHWFSTASVSKPVPITATFSPPQTEGLQALKMWDDSTYCRDTLSLPQVCAAILVLPALFFSYIWSSSWVLVNECDWKWCGLFPGLMHWESPSLLLPFCRLV